MKYCGMLSVRNGNVETRPVELLDILKTSLQVAGASQEEIDQPYGESLLPLLTGRGMYHRTTCFYSKKKK